MRTYNYMEKGDFVNGKDHPNRSDGLVFTF